MSGGHWDYFLRDGRCEIEGSLNKVTNAFRFIAAVERVLDWGHSGDSCLDCARLSTAAALDVLFDYRLENIEPAVAVLSSGAERCPRCAQRGESSAPTSRIQEEIKPGDAFICRIPKGRDPGSTAERVTTVVAMGSPFTTTDGEEAVLVGEFVGAFLADKKWLQKIRFQKR